MRGCSDFVVYNSATATRMRTGNSRTCTLHKSVVLEVRKFLSTINILVLCVLMTLQYTCMYSRPTILIKLSSHSYAYNDLQVLDVACNKRLSNHDSY